MDHLLLKPLEEMDALWIASTARPEELDPMFLRRFAAHVSTALPARAELVKFLVDRCHDWTITVDDHDTLELVARRSQCVTATAIAPVAIAAGKSGRLLSRELVLRHYSNF
jgi:SpoVK/Ycf46/Vps4 family AAA+-type ATPase